ncbi:MAG: response regulator [Calditrichales bacterium]|nr:MAG: response regulator [Calditrichales bacterium]
MRCNNSRKICIQICRKKFRSGSSIIYFILFYLLHVPLHAFYTNTDHNPKHFDHIPVSKNLEDMPVFNVIQDHEGYLWFGSERGLYRYDGYDFKLFGRNDDSGMPRANNTILSLAEDRQGILWIGTENSGLYTFNPFSNQYNQIDLKKIRPDRKALSTIRALLVDFEDKIWFGADDRVCSYDQKSGILKELNITLNHPGNFQNLQISALQKDQDDLLWIGTNCGLSYYNLRTGTCGWLLCEKNNPNSLTDNNVTALALDNQGMLWIGTKGSGLNRYNPKSGEFKHYSDNSNDQNHLSSNYISSLLADRNNQLWIGTYQNGGINLLDLLSDRISYLLHEPGDHNQQAYNNINGFYEDRSGIIWITTDAGICRYIQSKTQFFQIKTDLTCDQFDNWMVEAICEDSAGTIWIGTQTEGLYALYPEQGKLKNYIFEADNKNSISSNTIRSIFIDNQQVLWAGTNHGLNRFDLRTQNFTRYYFYSSQFELPENICIYTIFQDHLGTLWLGTDGGGLIEFNPVTGSYEKYQFDSKNSLGDPKNKVWAICEDKNDNLWIGTWSGLKFFKRKDKTFQPVENYFTGSDSSSNDIVLSLCNATDGNIWTGTLGNGLIRYSPKTGLSHRFSQKNEISSNTINSILEDNNGNLWLSSTDGIIKFNPGLSIFQKLTSADGLQSNIFSRAAYHNTRSNHLYFGSNNGFNAFNPEKISFNSFIPPIVISEVLLAHNPVSSGEIHTAISSSSNQSKPLLINPDQAQDVSIKFSALDYLDPENNLYKYKLEGHDKDWVSLDNKRTVSFMDLDPGEYIFKVKASKNDAIWTAYTVALPIKILPYFYQTNWAYACYILLFIVSVFTLIRLATNKVLLKNQLKMEHLELTKQKQIDLLKSKFLTNISHEFRTPLTLILGPVDKWLKNRQTGELHEDLILVKRNGLRIWRLINQLLDLSMLDSGNLKLNVKPENIVEFLHGLVLSFASLAEQKDINLSFISSQDSIIVYIDRDKIEDIISNLIYNAFKYTPANGKISVSCITSLPEAENESSAKFVEIAVRDTGRGIAPDHLENIFNRFYQEEDNDGISHEGTGIGLSLVRELTELHHGKITLDSRLKHGSVFTVFLPLGKDHFSGDTAIKFNTMEAIASKHRERIFTCEDISAPTADIFTGNNPALPVTKDTPHLLIVEDNFDVRLFLRKSLSTFYRISEAGDGRQGLACAIKTSPNLIISDVMMPEMDGITFCHQIKSHKMTSHIPVILLTAKATLEGKIEGLDTGADDYIFKPFEMSELLVRCKNLIAQRKKLQQRFREEIVVQPSEITVTAIDKVFLDHALNVVERFIGDPVFDTQTLADELGMSRMNLHRKLKALTGQTAAQFICTIRLKRATQLIKGHSGNISEVAYEVGFNSLSYFARCFKTEFGILPSEFAKSHQYHD